MMAMTDEIYRSWDVSVTPEIVKISGTAYPVANIGAVSVTKRPPNGGFLAGLSAVVGALIAVLGIVMMLSMGANILSLGVLIIGAGGFIFVLHNVSAPTGYALTISTSSGDRQALTDLRISHLIEIMDAIEQAIATARSVRPDPSHQSDKQQPPAGPAPDETECPFCAEIIKAKAKVCKHCGRDIPPPIDAFPDAID